MASAYGTIANGGLRVQPTAIERVEFPGRHEGGLGQRQAQARLHRRVAAKGTEILVRNIQGGTGGAASIGCPAGGKTGTTDNHTDAWFVGYTPNLSTSVWVGYPKSRVEMYPPVTPISVNGGSYPAQIWGAYMRQVKRGCGDFPQPKTPFQAAPFFGRYATTGAPGAATSTGTTTGTEGTTPGAYVPDSRSTGEAPAPSTPDPANGGNGGGGNGYDPDLYETPPQTPPPAPSGGATPAPSGGTGAPGE
jgi:penicillin-binding protein 1A